jgi:hypothetical protein
VTITRLLAETLRLPLRYGSCRLRGIVDDGKESFALFGPGYV